MLIRVDSKTYTHAHMLAFALTHALLQMRSLFLKHALALEVQMRSLCFVRTRTHIYAYTLNPDLTLSSTENVCR